MPKIPPELRPSERNGKAASNDPFARRHLQSLPAPGDEREPRTARNGSQVRQDRRDRRVFQGRGVVGEGARYLSAYMAMPNVIVLVVVAWCIAARMMDVWDRFPHLAITSPEKRCGKSLLLELLSRIVPNPRYTTNISPAALYRVIQLEEPTLLMDESQSLSRRASEASEVIREILNAGISRDAKVIRCGGERWDEIQEFSVYSPKVFALIGQPDAVLADRCLSVAIKRKTKDDVVERYRSRTVEERGKALSKKLDKWAKRNAEKIREVYDNLEPLDINNDRMADLLLPLQAVLTVAGGGELLEMLGEYAAELDRRDHEQEAQSPGVRLLAACKEIFEGKREDFLQTISLLVELTNNRPEDPWETWCHGQPMNAEALSRLLRPYGIKPGRNKKQTGRGYHKADFEEAWNRYLPTTPEKAVYPV